MARGQSQRSSASVRSEFGESTTLSKKASKVVSAFDINMIQPLADGSAGIDAGRLLKAIKEIDFGSKFKRGKDYEYQEPEVREQDEKSKSESVGVMTDILELNYLKSAKALTLAQAEENGETSPALTRTVNGRYDPKIKELESSIEDGFRKGNGFNADIAHIEKSIKQIVQKVGSERMSGNPAGQVIGAYKQGDVKKLFNDIYDTLNS
jgi:hypothetical protein